MSISRYKGKMWRWALSFCALTLAVGLLVLLWMADTAIMRERFWQHEQRAEAVFTAMETELTLFIEEEEKRPVEHYRYHYLPEGLVAGSVALVESPIAAYPPQSPVSFYISIENDGAIRSPHIPLDENLARSNGWIENSILTQRMLDLSKQLVNNSFLVIDKSQKNSDANRASFEKKEIVDQLLSPNKDRRKRQESQGLSEGQAPSAMADNQANASVSHAKPSALSTPATQNELVTKESFHQDKEFDEINEVAEQAIPQKPQELVSQQKSSFNSIFGNRSTRSQQIQERETSPASKNYFSQNIAINDQIDELAKVVASGKKRKDSNKKKQNVTKEKSSIENDLESDRLVEAELDSAKIEEEIAVPLNKGAVQTFPERRKEEVIEKLQIAPFVGHSWGGAELALLRDVRLGDNLNRQGFIIDKEALMQRLESVLAADQELVNALQLSWEAPRYLRKMSFDSGSAYQFQHNFGEPFDSMALHVSMQPLASLMDSQRQWLWVMGAALLIIGFFAVFTIERMVDTRLAFAARRQNFVAAVSHELKTPLTSIRMYAEMLQGGMLQAEEQKLDYYKTIQAESERLSRMINNVLDLSQLERDSIHVQLQCGSLRSVLSELEQLLAFPLEKEGFTLCFSGLVESNEDDACYFDRELLLQVLLNICDNSMKFSKYAQHKEIHIHVERVQNSMQIKLRDHGPGVAEKHLAKIFESFYRGEDEQCRQFKGSGIGLALVKGIIQSMNGQVSARNHPHGGFELILELACFKC